MKRKNSPPVTAKEASYIKLLLDEGLFQHQIAALLNVNQGRVSEIKTGKKFGNIPPAQNLPEAYMPKRK